VFLEKDSHPTWSEGAKAHIVLHYDLERLYGLCQHQSVLQIYQLKAMPTLSIIVPTFNSGGSIRRCLDSISRQTFTDYEVVIQDGASSDATIDLIKDFQKANAGIAITFSQERDKGPYDAMNNGIQRAKGEWLYFLGSDDELHDQNVLKTIMEDADTGSCNVVYGNVKVVGKTDWANDGNIYDGVFNLEKLLTKSICHQAIFYRAELVRQIGGYNLNYVICADWDFTMRCWSKTQFKYVDLIVADFHAGGLSSSGQLDVRLGTELASNVIQYFNLSIYDPLVNRPAFAGFGDIKRMQQAGMPLRRQARRIYGALARRLKLLAKN